MNSPSYRLFIGAYELKQLKQAKKEEGRLRAQENIECAIKL